MKSIFLQAFRMINAANAPTKRLLQVGVLAYTSDYLKFIAEFYHKVYFRC